MADTFSQIYIHIVFAVKRRQHLIDQHWEEELYKYIGGIIKQKDQKPLAINGMPNHIHILIGMKPSCCLSDLVREIKRSSTAYIKEQEFSRYKFQWQEGFAAFSHAQSTLGRAIFYIQNQKEHHKKQTFKVEYKTLLDKYEVEYTDHYLFD